MDSDGPGTVRWFGDSWGAPVCDPRTHVEAPVGRSCTRCEVAIAAGDQGITVPCSPEMTRLPWHLDCWLQEVAPGITLR